MVLDTSTVVLIWGALSGYVILRSLDSLLAALFCLHGLLMCRWKRLVNKETPGQIAYDIILNQLFKAGILGLVLVYILEQGNNFIWNEFRFSYQGRDGLLWVAAAGTVAIIFLLPTWRRLVVAWKITHEVGYAHKRQRTYLLRK
ncbi:MAG: hypothetical protein J7K75_12715 [Desulfuromonas sp.]|nr:hypothetical protein [Desulfuromonas sp.]